MGSLLSFYQHKNHKWVHVWLTGPLNPEHWSTDRLLLSAERRSKALGPARCCSLTIWLCYRLLKDGLESCYTVAALTSRTSWAGLLTPPPATRYSLRSELQVAGLHPSSLETCSTWYLTLVDGRFPSKNLGNCKRYLEVRRPSGWKVRRLAEAKLSEPVAYNSGLKDLDGLDEWEPNSRDELTERAGK